MTALLLVHAHPDDESILTGGVIARAHLDGHRVFLVTATGGEEGALHDAADRAGACSLAEIRSAELRDACDILGVDQQYLLGFRDSGMQGATSNALPDSFAAASLEATRDSLASVLRAERPDVVVTYAADGTYGHPDHVKAHATTLTALDLLSTEGWQPAKVYGHAVPRSFVQTVSEAARRADIHLPEGLSDISGVPDEEITTVVDVSSVLDRKLAACVAHRSQMHPGLPLATIAADLFEAAFGIERFVLLRGQASGGRPETSLFAGL